MFHQCCNALHLAAFNGHELVIQFFVVDFQIDVNCRVIDDLRRPAHFAAVSGSTSCIRVLHKHGADLGALSCDGSTPLHTAVRAGRARAVRTLLELGPANPVDNERMTPFLHALRIGLADVMRLFVSVERFRPEPHPGVQQARSIGLTIEAVVRASEWDARFRPIIRAFVIDKLDRHRQEITARYGMAGNHQ